MKNVVLLACLTIFGMDCSFGTDPNGGAGAIVWTAVGASYAAPAVADSTVYFATSDHAVTALDSRTGQVRWRSPTGETLGGSLGGNVLVVGALVIAPDLGLYGFDRITGARRWAFRPASGDTPGRFTISTDGVRVFMGSAAGYAYGVDALTGVPVWINPLAVDGNSVVSHPVTDRGLVFVTLRHFTNPSTGGVVALDALTGAIRWQRDFVATGPGRGAGSYGRVGIWRDLVFAAADDGTVYALNRDSGAVVWISPRPVDEGGYDDQRPITVVGDIVAVGSDRPVLAGLDAATGQQRWTIQSAFGSVNYQMGGDSQYLFLSYGSLQLSAIDVGAGRIVWTNGGRPGDYAAFAVADAERVYVPGFHGLYALRR
jgi:outer membrane protein assembly factor BamB